MDPSVSNVSVDTSLHLAGRLSSIVPRPRLLCILNRAASARLTLVVAPAG